VPNGAEGGAGRRDGGTIEEFIARQLTDNGFEVLAADGARKAFELVEAARPALVVLDAVLPDLARRTCRDLVRAECLWG
jgi:DNA-binding response OmpR family regulator